MKTNLLLLKALLVLSTTLAQPIQAQCQPTRSEVTNAYVTQSAADNQPADADPDEGKSHWRISTDPISRSTTVQFFSPQQRVLYEEVLPGQYVPLNDRNVAHLDHLLSRISANNLVASAVNTSPLLSESRFYKERTSKAPTRSVTPEAAHPVAGLRANLAYNADRKKLIVRFANPSGSRVNLKLTDERDRELYWNSVVAPEILQRFDMGDAPDGRYTLVIYRPYTKERYVHKVQIRSGVLLLTDQSSSLPVSLKTGAEFD